ncbi:hypothetical protein AB1Y20_019204 [Prymnesium parvum]|uniref:Ion transport domain-containing protein n=1 Tax=Prymnesium parvum TaxID=97485 RepID=A0AB34JQQ4_PRYPA
MARSKIFLEKKRQTFSRKRRSSVVDDLHAVKEAANSRKLWKKYRLLPPTSKGRTRWNQLMLLFVLYNCFQIPLSLSITFDDAAKDGFNRFDFVVDSFFLIDMLLNFRTSYYEGEELVTDGWKVMKTYAEHWFLIDFIATFPWQILGLRVMKLCKVLRLTRLAKGGSLRAANSARILRLAGGWMLVTHWTACTWFAIGTFGYEEQKGSNSSLQYESWMLRVPPIGRAFSREQLFSPAVYSECIAKCMTTHVSTNANSSRYPHSAVYLECTTGIHFQLPEHVYDPNCDETGSCWCDDNNFFPYIQTKEDWLPQYLSSFYWALTMLMKTPFVGPDTVLEKAFSCFIVILGAILFALLLGQFTAFLNSLGKTSAQLRDSIGTASIFCASRELPMRLRKRLYNHIMADWSLTHGMDVGSALKDFPFTIRCDVLKFVFEDVIDTNPSFLRCSEQLRLHILTIFKPSVAIKKETIVHGGQFSSRVFVLIKGTLQASLSQVFADDERSTKRSPGSSRTPHRDANKLGKGKSFKEKLKCRLISFEAMDLAKILVQYDEFDTKEVEDALGKEYLSIVDHMSPRSPGSPLGRRSSDMPGGRRSSTARALDTQIKLAKLEHDIATLSSKIDGTMAAAAALPKVLKAINQRLGLAKDVSAHNHARETGDSSDHSSQGSDYWTDTEEVNSQIPEGDDSATSLEQSPDGSAQRKEACKMRRGSAGSDRRPSKPLSRKTSSKHLKRQSSNADLNPDHKPPPDLDSSGI